jgi:hypothetical protein
MWDLWWTKWHWGRFSPSTSVSPANSHSSDCSTLTIIYHLGLVQQAKLVADVPSGHSLTPPQEIKKKLIHKQLSSSSHTTQPPQLEQDRRCTCDTVCIFVYDRDISTGVGCYACLTKLQGHAEICT